MPKREITRLTPAYMLDTDTLTMASAVRSTSVPSFSASGSIDRRAASTSTWTAL